MSLRYAIGLPLAALSLALLAGCGTPQLSSDDRVSTRVAEELSVAATLTAVAGSQVATAATAAPATATMPTDAAASAVPTEVAATGAATEVATAEPSAAPTEEPSATPEPARPTNTPEPPPPSATPEPPSATPSPTEEDRIAYQNVEPEGTVMPDSDLTDDAGNPAGRLKGSVRIADARDSRDGLVVVRDRLDIRISARVEPEGQTTGNGDGVKQVQIRIVRVNDDGSEDEVHSRNENTAAYCSFGGGEPDCNVWDFREHDNRWPNGKQLEPGKYKINALIILKDIANTQPFWFKEFYIDRP